MWIITVLLLIFILGIIILVHELGHFFWAKKFGVHIYEFSLGMGKVLFSHKGRDGIDYNIRAVPIGGFVSMAGEVYEDGEKIKKEKYMCNKPWWQRIIILVAGVMNNFILAIVLLFVSALIWGGSNSTTTLDKSIPEYPAYEAGIRKDDKIIAINGKKVKNWDVAQIYLLMKDKDGIYDIDIETSSGDKKTIGVKPTSEDDKIYTVQMEYDGKDPEVVSVKIKSDSDNLKELVIIDHEGENKNVRLEKNGEDSYILDGKENVVIKKTDEENIYDVEIDGEKVKVTSVIEVGKFGLNIKTEEVKGFLGSLKYAFSKFGSIIHSMWLTIGGLITGKIPLSALSGPVGIYQVVDQSVGYGIDYIIYLIAFLSINVGFINILPFPAFDGGRVFFIAVEKIKGSPINSKFENTCHTVGFVLLMILMIVITIHDIFNLF